jgi:hypothetical protein
LSDVVRVRSDTFFISGERVFVFTMDREVQPIVR